MKGQVGQPGPDTIFLSQHPSVNQANPRGRGREGTLAFCCVASFVLTWEERGTQDSGKLAGFLLPVRKLQAISGEKSLTSSSCLQLVEELPGCSSDEWAPTG